MPNTPISAAPHTWTIETLAAFFAVHLTTLEERLNERATAHNQMHVALETRLTEAQEAHVNAHLASHLAMEDKIGTAFRTHASDHSLLKDAQDGRERIERETAAILSKQAELWRANANEWRGAMSDRERDLMPRSMAEQRFGVVEKDIEALKIAASRNIGSRAMATSVFSGAIALLSLLIAAVSMLRR